MYLFTFTAILASAVTTASAAGCYSETGPGWGDLRQAANNAADAVCNGDSGGVAGIFDGNSKYACRNLGETMKAEFWVTGTGSLSDQDCKFGLKEEINGCGWDGENTHGSFYYRYVWVLHSIYKGCW
ncbi:hypothetical protein AA0114_g10618 [Alternaria tenuissima]|uniref:Ecp2 effector protein domain-containing protein n=1 Tax=Alternaria tenuissima TaxID=119927 RepID=A0A4Q4M3W3_9PLEO|nr:hypothetical protein AA0114_g10618 [Alternaria tenuissima]